MTSTHVTSKFFPIQWACPCRIRQPGQDVCLVIAKCFAAFPRWRGGLPLVGRAFLGGRLRLIPELTFLFPPLAEQHSP